VAQSDDSRVLEAEAPRSFSDTPLVPAAFRDLAVLRPAPRRFRARAVLPAVAVLLMAAAAGYGWYYWTVGQFLESTNDAYVQADSTIVAPKVSGYLHDVQVSDNQSVKAGQLLATIEDADYVAALDHGLQRYLRGAGRPAPARGGVDPVRTEGAGGRPRRALSAGTDA
jgi:hypothetical protein